MEKELRESNMGLDIQSSKVLKGGLSIIIVLHHLQYGIGLSFLNVFKHLGAPAVSIFFFLSGYGLMTSYNQKGVLYLNGFWRTRIWNIFKPFIIVTLVYLLLDYLDKGNFNSHLWHDLISKGNTPLPYSWYVFTILLLYAAFFCVFCVKQLNTKWKIVFMFLITIFYILLTKNVLQYDRAWWVSALGFPIGIVYRYYQDALMIRLHDVFRKTLGILFLLVMCGLLIITKNDWLYIFVYMIIPVITVLLVSCFGIPKLKPIMFLGDISYEIYLLHGVWIILLRGAHIYVISGYVYVISVFLFTIATSFFLKYFLNLRKNNIYENTSNR